jgi:queuosine precursor transporter
MPEPWRRSGTGGTVAPPMKLDTRLTLFLYLVGTFLTCLLIGDLVGGKLTSFTIPIIDHTLVFSVGQLSFPLTFVLTDIINEFYGRKVARKVTYLAFWMVGLAVVILIAASAMPWWSRALAPDWDGVNPPAFERVFSNALRIQVSSMFAFLLSQVVDISVFFLLKKATGDRMLWLRATGSTAVSQIIDTAVITALVFGEKMTMAEYVKAVTSSYEVKLMAAIVVTPLIYVLHEVLEKRFRLAPARADVEATDVGGGDRPSAA